MGLDLLVMYIKVLRQNKKPTCLRKKNRAKTLVSAYTKQTLLESSPTISILKLVTWFH